MDADTNHDGRSTSRPPTPPASQIWGFPEHLTGRADFHDDAGGAPQPRDGDFSSWTYMGNQVDYSQRRSTFDQIELPDYGVGQDFSSQQPPMLQVVDSVLAQEQPLPPQPKKLLRKRHKKMSKLRETVLQQREQIQMEYQDLSFRMDEVRRSLEEFMNNLDPRDDDTWLRSMWERMKSDMATFMARLERVDQLSDPLIESEARLIVADEDFMTVANAIAIKTGGTSKKVAKPAQQPAPVSKVQEEEENRSLLNHLGTLRTNISFFKDRLNELEWEQDEELTQRELLYDQGRTPDIPERQFLQSYVTARDNIREDLRITHEEIAQLEATARERGLDTSILSDIQAWSYVSSQADADDQQPPEPVDEQNEEQPYSEHAAETEKKGSDGWSSQSLAGSPPDNRATSIGNWLQNVEDEPLPTMDVEVAHSLKRRITTGHIKHLRPQQTLRRRSTVPPHAVPRSAPYMQPLRPSLDQDLYVDWERPPDHLPGLSS